MVTAGASYLGTGPTTRLYRVKGNPLYFRNIGEESPQALSAIRDDVFLPRESLELREQKVQFRVEFSVVLASAI